MKAVPATELVVGDILLLPANRTATISEVKIGKQFVNVRTEYGSSRFGRYDSEVLIEDRKIATGSYGYPEPAGPGTAPTAPSQPATEPYTLTVTAVPPATARLCGMCSESDAVAYLGTPERESTSGYCAGCLCAAITDILSVVVPEAR